MDGTSLRKDELSMTIHVGMLEALGVNMYTSVGQSLVEFIANGFDADAKRVDVKFPFDEIESERAKIREKAKEDGFDLKQGVYDPLPSEVEIVVADDGHGMTVHEIEDKFLVLSRNRRKQGENGGKSESGERTVMGRKGLGKLAGFGAAQEVEISTKRRGETYSTTIRMDFDDISEREDVGKISFKPEYKEGLDPELQGTTVKLRRLRCDSIKSSESAVRNTLIRNFGHFGDDFDVYLEGDKVVAHEVDYEFTYNGDGDLEPEALGELEIEVEDEFSYPIKAWVGFRYRKEHTEKKGSGNLPTKDRGARVYCNGRLAAGPTLFDLHTGMHNFHSQSYMECVVHADVLDQLEADLISTNRQGFKTDNVVVDAFVAGVTELMRKALAEHGKYRDRKAIEDVENDPDSQIILRSIGGLNRRVRKPAEQILRVIAAEDGVRSEKYREIAPNLVQAINSTEVLAELISSGNNPKDLATIITQLAELGDIERSDVLKLYRGRRNGIEALRKLEERSHDKGPKYEQELHTLLKENPWLIKPEYSNYLTSDAPMGDVAKKLNAALKIDNQGSSDDKHRPDLVFVALDTHDPHVVTVVELKSPDPNTPLDADHLTQLEGYIGQIESILEQDYQGRRVSVQGHLVGNMPRHDTKAVKCKTLIKRQQKAGPTEQWEIISVPDLLARTRNVHLSAIETIEAEEKALDDATSQAAEE